MSWGYERWLVSVHLNGQSLWETGDTHQTLSSICPDYPLLVKFIQADDMLSVQVHPDDVYAERMNSAATRASAGIFLRQQNTAEKRSCAPRLPPEWWNHALFASRYKKATLSIFRQGAFMRLAKVSAHLKYSSQAILHTVYTIGEENAARRILRRDCVPSRMMCPRCVCRSF